jgi:8-amino-7-oxononanoate synthase
MKNNNLENWLSEALTQQRNKNLLRQLVAPEGLKDFCSNDYLGLAQSAELFNIIKQKIESLHPKKNGATGSRLLSGNSSYAEEVEKKLSTVFKTESTLLFNSGYAANQAVLSCIPKKGDIILYDELAHACIKDGARLSLAEKYSFRHNNLDDLENKIKRIKANRIFIAVESIYSMDGDSCPLAELTSIASTYGAVLIVDEAHSTGVMGKHGGGLSIALGLESKIDIRIHTFGKAMGVHGACVVGSNALIEYLINFARPFIYTTALPLHSVASIDCAFKYLGHNMVLQSDLMSRIDLFLANTNRSNRTFSKSAIQTAIIPGNAAVKKAAQTLQQSGFDVRPILSPTVTKGSERLRICLHTYNTEVEIQNLAEALNAVST